MAAQHNYAVSITWTGNKGTGTSGYTEYGRDFTLSADGKAALACSADVPFRGDGSKYNPEDMLLASISSCHMLWFFHLCADAGIVVTEYTDHATGVMVMVPETGGHFSEATLHPVVTVADAAMVDKANSLHAAAHKKCFISNSVNFPIGIEPRAIVK